MPTYEYQCLRCGHRFEEFQNMTEEPLERCPKCGGTLERLISGGSGFIFKGPGFYATDYARKERESSGCCGQTNPCEHPKRSCDQ